MSHYTPAEYDAWYQTPRGRWMAAQELRLLKKLWQPQPGNTVLDVGTGTGYFARAFSAWGQHLTGLDPDQAMLDFARQQAPHIAFIQGRAEALPFADNSFDYCSAITSLCFVKQPERAVQEMWRVSRKGIVLGLLNKNSRLYQQKANSPGYKGARWDDAKTIDRWAGQFTPSVQTCIGTALFMANNEILTKILEAVTPNSSVRGGFITAFIEKS